MSGTMIAIIGVCVVGYFVGILTLAGYLNKIGKLYPSPRHAAPNHLHRAGELDSSSLRSDEVLGAGEEPPAGVTQTRTRRAATALTAALSWVAGGVIVLLCFAFTVTMMAAVVVGLWTRDLTLIVAPIAGVVIFLVIYAGLDRLAGSNNS